LIVQFALIALAANLGEGESSATGRVDICAASVGTIGEETNLSDGPSRPADWLRSGLAGVLLIEIQTQAVHRSPGQGLAD
jgi:hypothetical protein